MQASSFFVSPHQTPKSVKYLIWITVTCSFLSPIFTFFADYYFHSPGPGAWLSLSLWGLKNIWLWQPITYFFLHSAGTGITLSLLVSLGFHMFLLWFTGSEIAFRFGNFSFLLFYLGGGLVVGGISSLALLLFSSPALVVGSGPPVYALLMVWAMLYPNLELSLFLFVRIRAKSLVAIFLGLALLIDLSNGAYISFFADFLGIFWGFMIGHFFWKLPNPFPLNLELSRKKREKNDGKIIDLAVFQESDEDFMERMLDKISKKGESALSAKEKERMEKISKKNSQS